MGDDEESSGGGLGTLITFIVIIIAVVILLAIAYKAYPEAFSFIGKPNLLDQPTQQKMEDNFDVLTGNLKNCKIINDYECLCDIMPSFPGSFVKQLELNFFTQGTRLYTELMNKNTKVRNFDIGDVNIQIKNLQKTDPLTFEDTTNNKITLQFIKQFPFEKDTKQFVASEKAYKGSNINVFLLTVKKPEDAIQIQQSISNFPMCQEDRIEAITQFEKIKSFIVNNIETQKNILAMPENYSINYDSGKIELKYKGNEVRRIIIEQNQNKRIIRDEVVKFEKTNMICQSSISTAGNLKPRMEFQIKIENNVACLSL